MQSIYPLINFFSLILPSLTFNMTRSFLKMLNVFFCIEIITIHSSKITLNLHFSLQIVMGCGSNISAVAQMSREGAFRPLKLLQMHAESEVNINHGKMYLFGETRTQRKIIQCDFKANNIKTLSVRTRIPIPKIHLDPIQTLYEQSQQIFHLGIYGSCMQPPFNKMLALFMQSNLIFLCGGCDYDHYNVKNQAFYYSIVDEPVKISSEMMHSSEFSQRTLYKPKYSKNKFQKMAGMNQKRYAHTGLYCNRLKSIMVFGGVNEDEKSLNSCEMYSVWQNAWKQLPSMKYPRAYAHCFLYGNKIYVFGGRSNRHKLSKKIEVFDIDSNKWQILNFKMHRGVEQGLVFSLNPNEILIVGGRGHFNTYRTNIKVDLKNQTYVWQSEISNDYTAIKGLHQNHELFLIGGKKDISEIYFHRRWKEGVFQHKKNIELEDMEAFTFTRQNLIVKQTEQQTKIQVFSTDDDLFFGNDMYPCLALFNRTTGKIKKHPVPLLMRLKSKMGIVQYQKDMFMLMGGCDHTGQKASRSCYFYDKCLGSVRLALKMGFKRFDFATIAVNNCIYVFGGHDTIQKQAIVQCQRYSFELDKWERISDLPKPRQKHKAELLSRDRIALIGGNLQAACLQQIFIYDTKNDTFEIYQPKEQLMGLIKSVHSRQEDNCIYVLRQNQTGDYFESKISLIKERKDSMMIKKDRQKLLESPEANKSPPTRATKGEESWRIVKVKSNLQKIQHPHQFEVQKEFPNVKQDDALELHPQIVPIKERKQHSQGQEQQSDIMPEKIQEICQIQQISFDSHEMMEEIRKSTRYLIQQTARQMRKQKQQEEQKKQSPQPIAPLKIEESPQSKNELKVDPSDIGIEYNLTYTLEDKLKDSKLIQWLNKNKSTILKRHQQTIYIGDNSIFSYEFTDLKTKQWKIQHGSSADDNIKMNTLA